MVELKSVRLVQRAYRSKFKNRPCPTAEAITKLSKKFDTTGTILDLSPNRRKSETFELMPEISWKYSSPKILVVDQKSLSWCWNFIQSLPWYSSQRFATQTVQIPEYSSTIVTWLWKKSHFCSMVAGLGKWCSQMVDR